MGVLRLLRSHEMFCRPGAQTAKQGKGVCKGCPAPRDETGRYKFKTILGGRSFAGGCEAEIERETEQAHARGVVCREMDD